MTFEELDSKFPNGLDDAEITYITVDYAKRTAKFQFNMRGNLPESPDRDVYSKAVLTTHDVHYLSIEPPDAEHLFGTKRQKITVDGLPEDANSFPLFKQLSPKMPSEAFFCRFFVHDWNSFIHIGASSAEFSWISNNQ